MLTMTQKQKKHNLKHAPKLKQSERLLPDGTGIIKVKILTSSPVCMPVVYPRDQWGRRLIINSTVSYPSIIKIPAACYNKRDVEAGLYKRIRNNTILPDIIMDRHPRTSVEEQEKIIKNKWHIEGPSYRFGNMPINGRGSERLSIHPGVVDESMKETLKEQSDGIVMVI